MNILDMEADWLALRASLGEMYDERLQPLLEEENEENVSQCMELLLSFGEVSLCAVLEAKDGEICLRRDLLHQQRWERQIIDHVSQEESRWYAQYQKHMFDDMEFRVLGSVDWSSLSEAQKEMVKRVSLRMNEIPAGSFRMGALSSDDEAEDDETPRHKVSFRSGMLVGRYVCTQGLYEAVMGENPSEFTDATRPVENVSWCDAVLFCNKLSELEGLEPCYELPEPFENDEEWSKKVRWKKDANGYRLPTEAEWEYCARAGQKVQYSGSDDMDEVAWHEDNSGRKTHPVGQKKANGFGLYDMSGNVYEWGWDTVIGNDEAHFSGESAYTSKSCVDPMVEKESPKRIVRGGSWSDFAWFARVSCRFGSVASLRSSDRGFRFNR